MPRFDTHPDSFEFSVPIQVQWGDMDALGHVNNARYLTYFETARCEFFRQFGVFAEGGDEGPVVAQAELRYRNQVSYPATIRVYIRSTAIRESSFRVEYAVYDEGTKQLVADGATLIVWVDFRSGKRKSLPECWRSRVNVYQPAAKEN